jgi:hypothetical protein
MKPRRNEEAQAHIGLSSHRGKKNKFIAWNMDHIKFKMLFILSIDALVEEVSGAFQVKVILY